MRLRGESGEGTRRKPICGAVVAILEDMPDHITAGAGPLLSIDEAAERLGVGVRFVRRLVAERRIRYFKIGRHIRFARADLDVFVAAASVSPRTVAAASCGQSAQAPSRAYVGEVRGTERPRGRGRR